MTEALGGLAFLVAVILVCGAGFCGIALMADAVGRHLVTKDRRDRAERWDARWAVAANATREALTRSDDTP